MHKHKQYPIRFPRNAAGIRAQEARANGGRSWWAVEWMRHLESMGMKARLGRGKRPERPRQQNCQRQYLDRRFHSPYSIKKAPEEEPPQTGVGAPRRLW